MRTQLLGYIDLDEERLRPELKEAEGFRYYEPYSEFLCGRPWKSSMLWAPGGEAGDNVIAHYDIAAPAGLTEYGKQLPYLFDIIGQSFDLEHLVFVRMALMSDSVLVPHRDYVEFDESDDRRPAHRLHVPLATSRDCLFAENDVVYRMNVGEIWSLDVTQLHSAAVLSEVKRMHLILDFVDTGDGSDPLSLLRDSSASTDGIPEGSISTRTLLTYREHDEIMALAFLIDIDNLKDVFGIVLKKHYRRDGGEDFLWRTMSEIGRRSGNSAVEQTIQELYTYYTLARAE